MIVCGGAGGVTPSAGASLRGPDRQTRATTPRMTMTSAAAIPRGTDDLLFGRPQCGQEEADVETSLPQSGHLRRLTEALSHQRRDVMLPRAATSTAFGTSTLMNSWLPRMGLPLAMACLVSIAPQLARGATDTHAPSFWRALKGKEFKVAKDTAVLPLALEATSLLGSTDPELRDGIGYEALATRNYHDPRLSPAELNELRVALVPNARQGLGGGEDDSLFLRSFSDLVLSLLAAQDLRTSFLAG